jgi:hypothetical protein
MPNLSRLVPLALAAVALAVPAHPAAATPLCGGTQSTLVVCADPGAGPAIWGDCIFVGPPPCVPVGVVAPQLTVDGDWMRSMFDPTWCALVRSFPPPYTTVGPDGDTDGLVRHDCPPYAP